MPPYKPFASKAQQGKLHALAAEGKISADDIHGKDEATKKKAGGFKGLPGHVAVRGLKRAVARR